MSGLCKHIDVCPWAQTVGKSAQNICSVANRLKRLRLEKRIDHTDAKRPRSYMGEPRNDKTT